MCVYEKSYKISYIMKKIINFLHKPMWLKSKPIFQSKLRFRTCQSCDNLEENAIIR